MNPILTQTLTLAQRNRGYALDDDGQRFHLTLNGEWVICFHHDVTVYRVRWIVDTHYGLLKNHVIEPLEACDFGGN